MIRPTTMRLAAIGTLMLALFATAAWTQEPLDRAVAFDIKPQSIDAALLQFSKQAQMQVMMVGKAEPARATSEGVKGTFAISDALRQLLRDTGLAYEMEGTNTIRIVSPTASSETAAVPIANAIRLSGNEVEGEAQAPEGERGEGSGGETLDEIVVTGTHIRGVPNRTVPVTVLDKAYIDSTGYSTTTQLLESLPQNFALANQSGVNVPGVSTASEQGSAINLRGIGEGTTLTLINGRRVASGFATSAVDVSALPLSAIERVEVMTDGASALYGSDAIGGVVNFILRDDFAGAVTRARIGRADGVDENRFSQLLGHTWGSGNALVSMEYYRRDLLSASERDFVPGTSLIGSLLPRDKNLSAMFSGRQELSPAVTLFADALYSERESFNRGGRITLDQSNAVDNPQFSATTGLTWRLGERWQLETSGGYSQNETDVLNRGTQITGGSQRNHQFFKLESAQVKTDGPVWTVPGGEIRVALGADWRSEAYGQSIQPAVGPVSIDIDSSQIVRSAFGEVILPLVGAANAISGARRIELSVAGRYDDYSNFGSSFDPRVGLSWQPVDGINFRTSYGTSYRAPRLYDYDPSFNLAIAFTFLDPGAAGGLSHQLLVFGNDTALGPQEATTYSIGADFAPVNRRYKLSLNYYNIDYSDQIASPPLDSTILLGNPASFGNLILRDPTVDQVNDYIAASVGGFIAFAPGFPPASFDPNFDPASIAVIVDQRRRNLSVTETHGLDAAAQYELPIGAGKLNVGIAGTYVFKLEQQLTATSDPFELVNTYSNPPQLRLRGSLDWSFAPWTTNVFVNYVGSYTDNRMPAAPLPIASHTTLDARVAYDFGARFENGLLSGMLVSLSAQNLFDRDPPRTAVVSDIGDMGFDPANASPLGRLIAVEVQKRF